MGETPAFFAPLLDGETITLVGRVRYFPQDPAVFDREKEHGLRGCLVFNCDENHQNGNDGRELG
jgi:hypothetical protein